MKTLRSPTISSSRFCVRCSKLEELADAYEREGVDKEIDTSEGRTVADIDGTITLRCRQERQ